MHDRIIFIEMAILCHNVVREMFSNGEYFPEFRDFATWKEIIHARVAVTVVVSLFQTDELRMEVAYVGC